MAKASTQTGSQKKATKAQAHSARKGAAYHEKGFERLARYSPNGSKYKSIEHKLESIAKGNKDYLPGGKGYKGLDKATKQALDQLAPFTTQGKAYNNLQKQFGEGGKAYSQPNFAKDLEKGRQLAEKTFQPIANRAYENLDRYTNAQNVNQYGRESGKGSSALARVLGQSRTDLEEHLGGQLGLLSTQFGGDIAKMNISENARQQELQRATQFDILGRQQQANTQSAGFGYSSAADKLNAERSAQFQNTEQRYSNLNYINSLGLGSAQAMTGFGHPNAQTALSVNPYRASNSSPNSYQVFAGQALEAGATVAGAKFGGPPGGAAANQAAKGITGAIGLRSGGTWGTNNLSG